MENTTSLQVHNEEEGNTTMLGFWVYIMTDCVLFASLFATYAVLQGNTFGGPSSKTLFSLPFILGETLILLSSSFTCGLAALSAARGSKNATIAWLSATFILGASFFGMELFDFTGLIVGGNGPGRSGFLSSYFTLVGTHGLHIAVGLLWSALLIVYLAKKGFTTSIHRKLALFGIFWHFLDIVWIFIFTIVYLYGHI